MKNNWKNSNIKIKLSNILMKIGKIKSKLKGFKVNLNFCMPQPQLKKNKLKSKIIFINSST
jgi:hypothetical protein